MIAVASQINLSGFWLCLSFPCQSNVGDGANIKVISVSLIYSQRQTVTTLIKKKKKENVVFLKQVNN